MELLFCSFLVIFGGVRAEFKEISYEEYVKKMNIKNRSPEENERRRKIFEENMETLRRQNQEKKDFGDSWALDFIHKNSADKVHAQAKSMIQYGITVFTDWTDEEFITSMLMPEKLMVARMQASKGKSGGRKLQAAALDKGPNGFDLAKLPQTVDWVKTDRPVAEDQKGCTSCYLFAALNIFQYQVKLKYNRKVLFSLQEFVDCFKLGNNKYDACGGGDPGLTFDYIINDSIYKRNQYRPYDGIQKDCIQVRRLWATQTLAGGWGTPSPSSNAGGNRALSSKKKGTKNSDDEYVIEIGGSFGEPKTRSATEKKDSPKKEDSAKDSTGSQEEKPRSDKKSVSSLKSSAEEGGEKEASSSMNSAEKARKLFLSTSIDGHITSRVAGAWGRTLIAESSALSSREQNQRQSFGSRRERKLPPKMEDAAVADDPAPKPVTTPATPAMPAMPAMPAAPAGPAAPAAPVSPAAALAAAQKELDGKEKFARLNQYQKLGNNVKFLLDALAKGPVAVVHRTSASIKQYKAGIIGCDDCNKEQGMVNHAAMAVGYDLKSTPPHMTFVNSWGTAWGTAGYYKIEINLKDLDGAGCCLVSGNGMSVAAASLTFN